MFKQVEFDLFNTNEIRWPLEVKILDLKIGKDRYGRNKEKCDREF